MYFEGIMDKNNPMCVKNYTTKVEFQGRGAPHNHGTIWIDMEKMEFMFVDKEGQSRFLDNYFKKIRCDIFGKSSVKVKVRVPRGRNITVHPG